MSEIGGIGKSVKSDPNRITSRQVNLLLAIGFEKGISGRDLLEFIEYECDLLVFRLEEIPVSKFNNILEKLRNKEKA